MSIKMMILVKIANNMRGGSLVGIFVRIPLKA